MAIITIRFQKNPDDFVYTKTLSTGDYNRTLEAYRALLDLLEATDAEITNAFAEGIFNGLKANVHRKEKDVASKNASDAINGIDIT